MKRISIERYGVIPNDIPGPADPAHTPAQDLYSGLIEGTRDDGTTWIIFLDRAGNPDLYWAHRDETGSVLGDPIRLTEDGDGTPTPAQCPQSAHPTQ